MGWKCYGDGNEVECCVYLYQECFRGTGPLSLISSGESVRINAWKDVFYYYNTCFLYLVKSSLATSKLIYLDIEIYNIVMKSMVKSFVLNENDEERVKRSLKQIANLRHPGVILLEYFLYQQ